MAMIFEQKRFMFTQWFMYHPLGGEQNISHASDLLHKEAWLIAFPWYYNGTEMSLNAKWISDATQK